MSTLSTAVATIASFATGGGLTAALRWAADAKRARIQNDLDVVATATDLNEMALALLEPYRAELVAIKTRIEQVESEAKTRIEKVESEVHTVRGLLAEAATILRDFIREARARNQTVPTMSAELRAEIDRAA